MVDEGSRAKPQVGNPFSGGVHDADVVLASPKQVFILFTQLRNAAHQQLQLLILLPAKSLGYGALSNASQSLLGMRTFHTEAPWDQEL